MCSVEFQDPDDVLCLDGVAGCWGLFEGLARPLMGDEGAEGRKTTTPRDRPGFEIDLVCRSSLLYVFEQGPPHSWIYGGGMGRVKTQ